MRLLLTSISIILILVLLASLFFWPSTTPWIILIMLIINLGMSLFLIVQKHWQSYRQAECTYEKMVRNLTIDFLGFILTMGAAIYAGGLAGGYIGLHAGIWFGLIAGFAGGFLSAWTVRFAWGKLVTARIQ